MSLRSDIIKELKEAEKKESEHLDRIKDIISAEASISSTINGGLFAGTAKKSISKSVGELLKKRDALKESIEWKREMISKYT